MWGASKLNQKLQSGKRQNKRFTIWIDGEGAWLVCLGDRITIGGPTFESEPADIPLLANLSRQHATLVRSGETYLLEAHSPTGIFGRPIYDRAVLNDGYEIELGSNVKLKFRVPSVLSGSAALEFVSEHRPAQHLDGVILMDETCLIGPGDQNHIPCRHWDETVALYRRDEQFWCKSQSELFVDGKLKPNGGPLAPGDVVSGSDFRFRIEEFD